MSEWAGVVLAGGRGERMKSKLPKPLHKLCGRELIRYPVEVLRRAGIRRVVVVVSPVSEEPIKQVLGSDVEYAVQEEPLGTGHALLQASGLLETFGASVVVLNSDSPLISASTIEQLCRTHESQSRLATLLSAPACGFDDLAAVVKDDSGQVMRIVEAGDPDFPTQQPEEVNAGAYAFDGPWLWSRLRSIPKAASGEYYITSLVETAAAEGNAADSVLVEEPEEATGINTRVHLAQAEAVLRKRIRLHWMLNGVTIVDPASTSIDANVKLGRDTVIHPNSMILGNTEVGEDCVVGPNSVIADSKIGDGCKITASHLEEAVVEKGVDMGPFCHLRPGAHLEEGVHLGNYVEVKNSRMGAGSAMGHFGYIGDADIGSNVNIGAGSVTCNYDGRDKHLTRIGDGAFIGCDTMLVAPVSVGANSSTGAGAVVTNDVPEARLAVGVPARIVERNQGNEEHVDRPS